MSQIDNLLSTLQDMPDMVIVVDCKQVGRVITMTFEQQGHQWTEQFLTMPNGVNETRG